MHHRNNTSGLQEATRRGFIVDTMEVAAQWSALEAIFANVRTSLMAVEGAVSATCHLSHSYLDGACLYFTFAAKPTPEFEQRYVQLWNACQRAALESGANVSHHHGVGLNRGRFLPESLGTGMDVLQSIKNTLDPRNIFNPGKLGLNPDSDKSKRKSVWP
jgi:alkyldihydroxyacetonephosphate synthase